MALTMLKSKPIKDPAEIPLTPLDEIPQYRAITGELARIDRRYKQAQRREEIAKARFRGERPTTSESDQAEALKAGGTVVNLPAEAELAGARREQEILNKDRIQETEKLTALLGEISHGDCKLFAAISADANRLVLEGLTLLFRGFEIGRVIHARLTTAGRHYNEHALPLPRFGQAETLGDPDQPGTLACRYKEWMRVKGLLP
jgi:hypothetical protein